ncbi:NYN domain-containing protein [Azospirillum himalayense]|uniref:NYN domain-containing protein n=1 Tax=Azospirillum himalayense TaxID=654847 RepID=A0ABW0GDD1_9PROT
MKVDLLIDGENFRPSYWPSIKAAAIQLGRVRSVIAFSCMETGWSRVEGVEVRHAPDLSGRNAADFMLAMHAAVLAERKRVKSVIIASGDDGFGAVARRLKGEGVKVFAFIPLMDRLPRRLVTNADLTVVLPPVDPLLLKASDLDLDGGWSADTVRSVLGICPADKDGWISLKTARRALIASGLITLETKKFISRLKKAGCEVVSNGQTGMVRVVAEPSSAAT